MEVVLEFFVCEVLAKVLDLLLISLGFESYLSLSSAFQLGILCIDSLFLK